MYRNMVIATHQREECASDAGWRFVLTTCKEGFWIHKIDTSKTKLRLVDGCPKNLLHGMKLLYVSRWKQKIDVGWKKNLCIWACLGGNLTFFERMVAHGTKTSFYYAYRPAGGRTGRPRARLCVQWDAQDPFPIRHRKECVHLDCMSCLMYKVGRLLVYTVRFFVMLCGLYRAFRMCVCFSLMTRALLAVLSFLIIFTPRTDWDWTSPDFHPGYWHFPVINRPFW
jgi:hypothetical protein